MVPMCVFRCCFATIILLSTLCTDDCLFVNGINRFTSTYIYKTSIISSSLLSFSSVNYDDDLTITKETALPSAFGTTTTNTQIHTHTHTHTNSTFADDFNLRKAVDGLGKLVSNYQYKRTMYKILKYDEEIQPISRKAWFNLLDSAIKRKSDKLCVQIMDKMLARHIICSSHQVTVVLSLCCNCGLYDESISLIDSIIAAGFEITVHNFSPLLKTCGTSSKACDIFRRMEFVGLIPNVISYTTAIKSCEMSGDWRSALELLELMKAHFITPNERSYCCVISAASKGYAGNVAYNVLREMIASGCPTNELCYGSALTACARCGMWQEVELLLNEMPVSGLPLSESVLMSVINVCRGTPKIKKHFGSSIDSVGNSAFTNTNTTNTRQKSNDTNAETSYISIHESKLSRVQNDTWERAIWLVDNWAAKTYNITESLFTMAMDACEAAQKYDKIIMLYGRMITFQVKPSKSAYTYVLRACHSTLNAEMAIAIMNQLDVNDHPKALTATTVASVFTVCKLSNRYDLLIQYLLNQISHNSNYISQNVPMIRTLMNDALLALTRNYTIIHPISFPAGVSIVNFYESFASNVTVLLTSSLRHSDIYFTSDAYPMACKLLLDTQDYASVKLLLNGTLYKSNLNYTRLYDFALSNIVKAAPQNDWDSASTVISLLSDLLAAGKSEEAVYFLLKAMELAKKSGHVTAPSAYATTASGMIPTPHTSSASIAVGTTKHGSKQSRKRSKRYSDRTKSVEDVKRAKAEDGCRYLLQLFMGGRRLVGKQLFPLKAYEVALETCRESRLFEVFLCIYKQGVQDEVDIDLYRDIIVSSIAKVSGHWSIAIQLLDEIKRVAYIGDDPPDLFDFDHEFELLADSSDDATGDTTVDYSSSSNEAKIGTSVANSVADTSIDGISSGVIGGAVDAVSSDDVITDAS